MENFDELLDRTDVQFIDLRNFDDKMAGGFIEGFTVIPFFGYLEHMNILVRTDGWNFTPDSIKDERALRNLFDEEKTLIMICAAGVRAGFVKSALEHLGYENAIFNAGAIGDYNGDRMVRGDGEYRIQPLRSGDFTPGKYVGAYIAVNNRWGGTQYATVATVIVNRAGGIEWVGFDVVHRTGSEPFTFTTKQVLGDAYNMNPDNEWWVQADALAAAIVANQGWIWTIDEDNNIVDSFAGVTISVDGYHAAFLDAISKAQ